MRMTEVSRNRPRWSRIATRNRKSGREARRGAAFLAARAELVLNAALMAEAKKYEIKVTVTTHYVAEQSDPAINRHVFAYTIGIQNTGNVSAQLISRHWLITDAEGQVQEVRGLGVVGHQPLLAPGQGFEYTSGCQLATPVGTMKGSYQMTAEDGLQFEAQIAEFVLSMPRVLH